jgi:hypothetical protein
MLTSAKNTVVYDGGLTFSTTTSYGTSALNISLTMGIPNADHPNYASATTTASTTAVFRVKLADAPAPTEVVCGDGSRGTGEVCDSSLTTVCPLNSSYYSGGYSEDSSTCSGKYACSNSCSACLYQSACTGTCGGGGTYSGGYCWYLGTTGQSCSTVCSTHGSCVATNWTDDAYCTLLTSLGADCSNGCAPAVGVRYAPYWNPSLSTCAGSSSLSLTCNSTSALVQRLCACNN